VQKDDKNTVSVISVRIDEDIKQRFRDFCKASGCSISVAVNMFVRACLSQKRIPIDVVSSAYAAKPQSLPDARKRSAQSP